MLEVLYPLARSILFRLDAERAHHLTLDGMRFAARWGLLKPFMPDVVGAPVRVMGIDFPNVVGLAAGQDKAGTCIDAFGAMGFGHVEIGTVTPRPQPGNPKPRLFRIPSRRAVINRMGFNNVGLDQAIRNVTARTWRGVLGFNIGRNFDTPNDRAVDDYLTCLRGAYAHADYIAVNISSPNTKGLRDLQQEDAVRALVGALKTEQERLSQQHQKRTPLAVKIAPDLSPEHVKALAKIFLEGKIDGVIATNTTIARDGVADLPIAKEAGGLSGEPVREKATAIIRQLHAELGGAVPIIGVGGILSGADAVEKLQAGASLVQVYTGLVYRGPVIVSEIVQAVKESGD